MKISIMPFQVIYLFVFGFVLGGAVGVKAKFYVVAGCLFCSMRIAKHSRIRANRGASLVDIGNTALWSSFTMGISILWMAATLLRTPTIASDAINTVCKAVKWGRNFIVSDIQRISAA